MVFFLIWGSIPFNYWMVERDSFTLSCLVNAHTPKQLLAVMVNREPQSSHLVHKIMRERCLTAPTMWHWFSGLWLLWLLSKGRVFLLALHMENFEKQCTPVTAVDQLSFIRNKILFSTETFLKFVKSFESPLCKYKIKMPAWGKENKDVECPYLTIKGQIWGQFDTVPSCDNLAVTAKLCRKAMKWCPVPDFHFRVRTMAWWLSADQWTLGGCSLESQRHHWRRQGTLGSCWEQGVLTKWVDTEGWLQELLKLQ